MCSQIFARYGFLATCVVAAIETTGRAADWPQYMRHASHTADAREERLCAAAGVFADRPNIILIMADDRGYECLSCNGSLDYKTPHLDGLAKQGVRFDHCYSLPICTPSRVKIMTGRYSYRNYEKFALLPTSEWPVPCLEVSRKSFRFPSALALAEASAPQLAFTAIGNDTVALFQWLEGGMWVC